jgi:hypothetical protein
MKPQAKPGQAQQVSITYSMFMIFTNINTDKKENKIFLIYKEIQMGSGAKLYMRKGFLMGKFSPYMRRPLVIYDFAPVSS